MITDSLKPSQALISFGQIWRTHVAHRLTGAGDRLHQFRQRQQMRTEDRLARGQDRHGDVALRLGEARADDEQRPGEADDQRGPAPPARPLAEERDGEEGGVALGQRLRPVRRAALCAPAGRAGAAG